MGGRARGRARAIARASLALVALAAVDCRDRRGPPLQHMKRMVLPLVHEVDGELESPCELDLDLPPDLGVHTIYLDAGHGAPKNPGNTSCFCEEEQDFTRGLALEVADYLEATGHFQVALSRTGTEEVGYAEREAAARRAGAEAFVSLHSDVRGDGKPWAPSPGRTCLENTESPGFVVIYSDEGDAKLVGARLDLARGLAGRMAEAGFLRYTSTYDGLYAPDAVDPSVLLDRHALDKRIFVLRKTKMPAVLVETHHALDPREAALWNETETRRAFAAALAQALADFFARRAI